MKYSLILHSASANVCFKHTCFDPKCFMRKNNILNIRLCFFVYMENKDYFELKHIYLT